jgi:hypothetical protein
VQFRKIIVSVVDLTFKRASELALAMEIDDKNTQEFKPIGSSEIKNVLREVTRKGEVNLPIEINFKVFKLGIKG